MTHSAQSIRSIWPYKSASSFVLPAHGAHGERSIGMRARTQFSMLMCEGSRAAHCLALELSATGVLVDRGRVLSDREEHTLFKLELFLPNQPRPVRALARVARRARARVYALRFVLISDVDRLTLMEHLDSQERDSLSLLEEVEHSAAE